MMNLDGVDQFLMNRRLLKDASLFYHQTLMSLPRSHEAWDYIRFRGISEETVERFLLGFTGEDSTGENLLQFMRGEGYNIPMVYSKLFSKATNLWNSQEKMFPTLGTKRITFPVPAEGNQVFNITSRTIPSSRSAFRHKHLSQSKWTFYDPASIQDNSPVFIVEGPMDRLSLEQIGYPSVCFLGTNGFKPEYAHFFKKPNVVFCVPDSEPNAVSRNANFLTYFKILEGVYPYIPRMMVIDLPRKGSEKVDPNSFFCGMGEGLAKHKMAELCRKSTPIQRCPEYAEFIRKRQEKKRKEEKNKTKRILVDKILSVPIVSVMEILGVELIRMGGKYMCKCISPDHEDSTPSMAVYPDTNTFFCFGCRASGDSIKAISLVKRMNFNEACNFIKKENL